MASRDMFQSLFFWMTPIKPVRVPGFSERGEVSILVLLDDSHQAHPPGAPTRRRGVSILVLLDDSHQGSSGISRNCV